LSNLFYVTESMRTGKEPIAKWLLLAALLTVVLPGCILIRTTEHRIILKDDGSGEALLRLIDLRSDGVTDSLVRHDFDLLMVGVKEDGAKEFERTGRKITDKQFAVHGDTLVFEVSYTFDKPTAVEGLRQTNDGYYLVVGEGREVVRTNGKVESWKQGSQRIKWDADARRLIYIIREKALPPSKSLAGLYLKFQR
jgi:hypothetical protein